RPSVAARARHRGFEHTSRFDYGWRDAGQGNLQTPAPERVRLARAGADIDVDKFSARRTLYERTSERQRAVAGLSRHREFEFQVLVAGSLDEDGFVGGSVALLDAKIDAPRRLPQHDSKLHVALLRVCCFCH